MESVDDKGKNTSKKRFLGLWGGRDFTPLENIVAFTVAAGTVLMGLSLFIGRPEASKDVLPFATGLIGFLGGLVTAMYQRIKNDEIKKP
jgi:hypothetical protein